MKVLLAEDERVSRNMLRRDLEKWGHEVITAENGLQAWDKFQSEEFAIVISDWMMPEMDGLELVRRIREAKGDRYVFIILLTAKNAKDDIVAGMEAGADDFLSKPFDRNELRVRLNAGERIIQLERNLADQNRLLDAVNQRMKRDLDAAARMQQSLLPETLPDMAGVRAAWRFRPCDELAGDFLNVFPLDQETLGLYVVDVSGHGVAASLLAVAISRVLTPEASSSSLLLRPQEHQPGQVYVVEPVDVAAELNRRFPMEKSGDKYFTILYATVNIRTKELTYVSAGHPPIIIVPKNEPAEILRAGGFAIGWFPEATYKQRTRQLRPGDRVFLYSDGMNEAMNADSEQFGLDRLAEFLKSTNNLSIEDSLNQLMQTVAEWCGSTGPKDDLSVLGLEILE